jgi:hypothetical protein
MYKALEEDKNLDYGKKEFVNLMGAVRNRATHIPKHEENYDYNAFRDLYKVIVEGGYKLKINPKYLSYNSLHYHYDLKKKVGNPNSKLFGHRYIRPIHESGGAGRGECTERQAEFREDSACDIPRSCDIFCVQGYRTGESHEGFHAVTVRGKSELQVQPSYVDSRI